MNRKLLIVALLILLPILAFGQAGKLRGLVTDRETGEPLIGANVMIVETSLGASTDMDGVFIILAVSPGIHAVRCAYIGYTTETIQNIRVSPNLTTTQDFRLATEAIRGEAVVVVAERPLIQRNTTNTVRMTVQEDIKNIPIRGVQNIVALDAGTVLQDGDLHIRGGRTGEVAYFIDGATATNPLTNTENISVIQEAIEEIQMQAGGYTAEHGGSASGIIRTTMRTGESKYKASVDYRTDDFVHSGEQFLGTSSYGHRNAVVTLSGPVPGLSKVRFFFAGQHNYMRNRNPSFVTPFSTNDYIDPVTGLTLGELGGLVDDGFEDRPVNAPLPDGGVIEYKRNSLPGSFRQENTGQGTIMFSATDNLKFRFTGSYRHLKYPTQGSNFFSNLQYNYYNNDRVPEGTRKNYLASLRATHIINPTTYYEVGVFYSNRYSQNVDPVFGHDWKKYTDRDENFANGLGIDPETGESTWRSKYQGPDWISTIYNFEMEPPDNPNYGYYKNNQMNIGGSVDFSSQLNKNWELRAGGRYDTWIMRQYSNGDIQDFMENDMGVEGLTPYPWETKYGDNWEYGRMVELAKAGGVNFMGWDVDGENKIDDGPYGPNKPSFASAYIQNKFEYKDLVLNFGFRYEMVDLKALRPVDYYTDPETGERMNGVEDPFMDTMADWLSDGTQDIDGDGIVDEAGWDRTEPYHYILPRFNFSFPVTDLTVFYALYGKYIQMPALEQVYRGYRQMNMSVSPATRSQYGWWGSYVGYTAKPEETIQYEMGIRQALSDNFAFTITGFYKDHRNLLRLDRLYSTGEGELPRGSILFCGYRNEDFSTVKGVELTLELRRTRRLSARVNYTISDARGTGADSRSGDVVVSDEVIARYPIMVFALDYNQPHRGSMMLDYRFAKGDGVLQGLGTNVLLTFNSGHAYTKIQEPETLGQADPWDVGVRALRDERGRHPEEALNSSYTPWNFNIDINVNKVFYLGRFNVDLYVHVLNMFNTKNIINVFPMTGTGEDDGWLRCPLAAAFDAIPYYTNFYTDINQNNRWSYELATGMDIYGRPRQIRVGMRLEFN